MPTTVAAPWASASAAAKKSSEKQPATKKGLLDIMSEQLAQTLDSPDVKRDDLERDFELEAVLALSMASATTSSAPNSNAATTGESSNQQEVDLDFVLAAQLQEEEDNFLWEQERHGPKGNVTVKYFQQQHKFYLAQEQQKEKEQIYGEDYDGEGINDEGIAVGPKRKTTPWKIRDKSLKGQGGDGEIITKHDLEINGWKNSRRLENSVDNCGSLGDTLVSNRIYNSFQHRMRKIAHSEKGIVGRTVEDDTTRSKTLDAKTRLVIHRLLDAGVLDSVNYVVRTGKEGVIFHALGPSVYTRKRPGKAPFPARQTPPKDDVEGVMNQEDVDGDSGDDIDFEENLEAEDLLSERIDDETDAKDNIPSTEFAVKVYKTTLTEFSNRHEYIEGDHRFTSLGQLSRQNNRKVVKIWAEKELKNMTRIFRAGIPCPEPVRLDKNVLIMSFIGQDGWGAPQLADLDLGTSSSKAGKCFVQTLLLARAMWDRCKLVHADLSEFNVLYMNGKCFVVDVGQAVERQHPHAHEFLRRDVYNVLTFFYNKCKRTGCGNADKQVDQIVNWITHGTPDPDIDVDCQEWSEYAKDLGSWADYRLAVKFAELLQ